MLIVLQVLAILAVFAFTLLFFKIVGEQTEGLLHTRKVATTWRTVLGSTLGGYMTISNIVTTLTSLATVYLFFIGSSKLFGWVTFWCCATIIMGGVVSNFFSTLIIQRPRPKAILTAEYQSGAVIASLFWANDSHSKNVSQLVRIVSLISMTGIIWLEFAVFGDISGKLLGFDIFGRALTVGAAAFFVTWFTFRYGLRGFVFADLLHAPLIVIAVIILFLGASYLFVLAPPGLGANIARAITPLLDAKACWLFALHVAVLNVFLVLVSESHWMRMWLFSEEIEKERLETKEITKQISAQFSTAGIWAFLILIGLLASFLTGKVETDAIAGLLSQLSGISTVFLVAFWIGGIAALMSTADAQLYCFRLVQCFDIGKGAIPDDAKTTYRPVLTAAVAAFGFAFLYWLFRHFEMSFEKLIFIIVPSNLVLLPALLQLALGQRVERRWIAAAIVLYTGLASWGLLQPESQLLATLSAAIAAAVVGGIAAFVGASAGRGKQ